MATAFSPIPELNLLKDFERAMEAAYFSEGFELWQYGGQHPELIADWLDSKAPRSPRAQDRLDRLIPFAQATGSGSFYVLWRCDDRTDLATLPVVFFGDEGDLDIVAGGLREFFQVLALDNEQFLNGDEDEEDGEDGEDGDHEVDEEDEEDREELAKGHAEYLAWLERTFGLGLPEDPDAITDAARQAYGQRLAAWLQEISPHTFEIPTPPYH
ncbi:hypothetical protein ACFVT2_41215 [Streptomyces sp. NPDC058000]|uniref:hypothetical protein n=1 Tax=Streptomyces sp. NPDC058000 TaxID=3346299 RepID=UPI0036EEF561